MTHWDGMIISELFFSLLSIYVNVSYATTKDKIKLIAGKETKPGPWKFDKEGRYQIWESPQNDVVEVKDGWGWGCWHRKEGVSLGGVYCYCLPASTSVNLWPKQAVPVLESREQGIWNQKTKVLLLTNCVIFWAGSLISLSLSLIICKMELIIINSQDSGED